MTARQMRDEADYFWLPPALLFVCDEIVRDRLIKEEC